MAGTPAPCQTRSVTRHRRFEFCFFASLAVAIAVEGAASFDHAARAEETRPSAAVDMTRLLEALGRHARDVRGLAEKGGQKSHLRYEELDGDGKASTWTETDFRRTDGKTTIVKSTKDGRDNTATAREEQQKRHAEEKKKKKKDEIGIPFEPNEQPKYSFSIAATDPLNPARVRIHFEPKGEPSDKTFIGEAWVDSVRGVMLTVSGTFSKNPSFVDHASMRAEFEATSPIGPMPSTIDFEGEGSFLWVFRKKIRVHVTVGEYTAGP